jgi:F-type H+-transporting ATPase subunit delta
MKINKEIRQLSRALLRGSFTDGQLDQGRVASVVKSLIDKKPRNYLAVLENYKRLLRLEIEKRTATIDSAAELSGEIRSRVLSDLNQKYGIDLIANFIVNPDLLGGMRIRVGDDVWDSSVRNRLERLEHQF